jgi:hypothetical protein
MRDARGILERDEGGRTERQEESQVAGIATNGKA